MTSNNEKLPDYSYLCDQGKAYTISPNYLPLKYAPYQLMINCIEKLETNLNMNR